MSRPMVTIHNLETDEVITREMNDEEFAEHQEKIAQYEAKKAEEIARANAKAELLAQLGITEEQARLLFS